MPVYKAPNCMSKSFVFGLLATLIVISINLFFAESLGLVGMTLVVIGSILVISVLIDVKGDWLFEQASLKLNKRELEELKEKPLPFKKKDIE